MAIKRMEHVGIVVDDLAAAIEFFVELGLEPRGSGQVEGNWVDRIVALDKVKVEFAMLRTPDGHGEIELVKFHSPPTETGDPHAPVNTPAKANYWIEAVAEGGDDYYTKPDEAPGPPRPGGFS